MITFYRRHASDEAWEKHLPKPIYIIYALSILAAIILVNVFATFAFSNLNEKSEKVLTDYTDSLEHFKELTSEEETDEIE